MAIIDIRSSPRFKQTVLLVDDQATVLSIHAAIIKSLDLDLTVVAKINPIEALAYIRKKQVDLLITDFRMPSIDGIHFFKQAKYLSRNKHVQIIVITALKSRQTYEEILAAGVTKCLFKPAQNDELTKIAYELLNNHKRSYTNNNVLGNANV